MIRSRPFQKVFGDASVAQSKLTNGANGDFFSINWGWGIGVMLAVLVAGGVSGKKKKEKDLAVRLG